MLLSAQVHILSWYGAVRRRLSEIARDERGDVYTTTIMIAIGVVIAITVGGILLTKFTNKANSIDTNTPVTAPGP